MTPGSEPPRGVAPGDSLLVIHNFDARSVDELTLRRGDKVELLELDEGFEDGWFFGRNPDEDKSGLFPGVYTTVDPRLIGQQSEDPPVPSDAPVSESPAAPPDKDERGSFLNDDSTPQASRPTSTSGNDANLEDKSNEQPTQSAIPAGPAPLHLGVQRTIDEAIAPHSAGEESPVLNETLSVIDEHITNLNTPRHSLTGAEQQNSNDSGSDYSGSVPHRLSYIPGAETDEEEDQECITEADVRKWDHKTTAQHLRALGVEASHCNIFEKEEITGDVLLNMDQEFIYMKEFDFGVMGRRLKTWYKIRDFQEAIRGPQPRKQPSRHGRNESEEVDRSQSRTAAAPFLPRIPSVNSRHGDPGPRNDASTNVESPPPRRYHHSPPIGHMGRNSASRPSADSIRRSSHRRRHSSIDSTPRPPSHDGRTTQSVSQRQSFAPRAKASFDRSWTMATGIEALPRRPDTSTGTSNDTAFNPAWKSTCPDTPSTTFTADSIDADRGYFSGGEVENRRSRNLLRKKRGSSIRSASYSRHSSVAGDQAFTGKSHSRFSSLGSMNDIILSSGAKQQQQQQQQQQRPGPTPNGRGQDPNSTPMAAINDESHCPTVTNLEGKSSKTSSHLPTLASLSKRKTENLDKNLPTPNLKNVAPKVRRAIGLRTTSDAVTGHEKSVASSGSASPAKESPKSPVQPDSSTPSGASREQDSTDSSLKGGDHAVGLFNRSMTSSSSRRRSKKETSAYTRGLEKKPPEEQIVGCDYYGWMKKKSSHLMTTWKPRLFVLRGRRLSYYYSEDDTEERGLIDISSHRVFRVDQDTITSLHATLTGATSSSTSPNHTGNADSVLGGASKNSPSSGNHSFIFKLVPPKVGSARGVQFTKPAVHFFQVDNIQQGRLWMAALMKSTIERDLNLPVRTTNKQTTVSLKQARGMNQLPPALMGAGEKGGNSDTTSKPDSNEVSATSKQDSDEVSSTSKRNSNEVSATSKTDSNEVSAKPSKARHRSKLDQMAENGSISHVLSLVQLDGLDSASLSLFPEPPPGSDRKD